MKDFLDIEEAQPVARTLLEKDVQKKCVAWARARGYWARKFSSQSQRSVPDYLFSRKLLKFFVEFKAPGKKATENQVKEQSEMRAAGWVGLQECDNFEDFVQFVKMLELVADVT